MKFFTLILSVLFVVSVAPDSASAQGVASLVPQCEGTSCSACHFVELGNNLVSWLIGVITVLFAVLMAVAGFGLVTSGGNPSALQAAKDKFTNGLIGFLIVLSAWLLIDTLMRGLLGNNGEIQGWGPWAEVQCWSQVVSGVTPGTIALETAYDEVDTVGMTAFGPTPAGDASVAGGGLSHADAVALVNAAGIEYKGNVSFNGVKPHVLNELAKLDEACNCNILVTSVTDGKHAGGTFSHSAGFKADLRTRDNPGLVNYVKSLPSAGAWKDGTKLYFDSKSCGTYAVEGDHIDVVYKTGC